MSNPVKLPPGCTTNDAELLRKAAAGYNLATALSPIVAKTGSGISMIVDDVQASLQTFIQTAMNASVNSALATTGLTRETICGNLTALNDVYTRLVDTGLNNVKLTATELATLQAPKQVFDKIVYPKPRLDNVAAACIVGAGMAVLGFAAWRIAATGEPKSEPDPKPGEVLSPTDELLVDDEPTPEPAW